MLYVEPCHIQLPPPGFDISHANTMRRKIQNRQKLETQRMKISTPGETFIISTTLVSINIKTTKNLLLYIIINLFNTPEYVLNRFCFVFCPVSLNGD